MRECECRRCPLSAPGKDQAKQLLASVREIPIELLEASAFNPRKTFDPVALNELAASVKALGFTSPLLVRPLVTEGLEGRFEVVAGHRRCEVGTMLGKHSLPCIVRDMSDAEAADLALVDNLQRVDVPALEEAEAFNELLSRYGSIEAVAAKVGKDVAHVAKRLKLGQLKTWSREALRERLINVDHALLLARLGEEEQDAALKWCLDPNTGSKTSVDRVIADRVARVKRVDEAMDDDDPEEGKVERARPAVWDRMWECESVQRLKEYIASKSGNPLDRAPWPMEEDWLVPDMGSCLDCPQNTKANTPLFGDLDINAAICTDGACFKAKTSGFVQIQMAELVKRESQARPDKAIRGAVLIVRVSWKSTSTPPRQLKGGAGVNPAQVFKDGQWVEAKKACEHTRAAVTVDWCDYRIEDDKLRKPGEIVQVCIEPKCGMHPKTYERSKASSGAPRDAAAEQEAREKKRVAAINESKLRVAFVAAVISGIKTLDVATVRCLATGATPSWVGGRKAHEAIFPGFMKTISSAKADSVEFARAVTLATFDRRLLTVDEYGAATSGRDALIEAARQVGFKGATPWDKPKPAKKTPAKKAAKPAAKKAAKKGGR